MGHRRQLFIGPNSANEQRHHDERRRKCANGSSPAEQRCVHGNRLKSKRNLGSRLRATNRDSRLTPAFSVPALAELRPPLRQTMPTRILSHSTASVSSSLITARSCESCCCHCLRYRWRRHGPRRSRADVSGDTSAVRRQDRHPAGHRPPAYR